MIEQLPLWIDMLFVSAVAYTIGCFYYTNNRPAAPTIAIVIWSVVQSIIAFAGFYEVTDTFPPRFAFVIIPVIVAMAVGLRRQSRHPRLLLRDPSKSMLIHIVRIPVEIVLFYLFLNQMIPELMTFEGRNFDILAGLTAPLMIYFYKHKKISKQWLLLWNYAGLLLLLFIVFNALLSAELPFQQFAFGQPNKAITFFPYVLLPATIVPIVLYTHISDILHLRKSEG